MARSQQLAAIIFTDLVGFTSLMGENEAKAFEVLDHNRDLHKKLLNTFNGRQIKELGDGNLCIFLSVSDAVNFAITIQKECNNHSDFSLRIGIHQAEVVFENGDVFGDGINIASRIESITPPGSIYVSETVLRNVENRIELNSFFIGEKLFKNVKHPIKIYQVHQGSPDDIINSANKLESDEIGKVEKSIAVLPFQNLSNDVDQEYLCDGLAEELINNLGQLGQLMVAARTSSFLLKGQNFGIADIGEKLNVKSILDGSVRKSGNRLRITAQLVNVSDGFQLWSEPIRC